MRYLKTIVASVLIVTAIFFVGLVLAQVFTGYDFSPAYSMLGSVSAVELALTAIIKRQEKKSEKKENEHD
jgi:FtsH-binding integral membrane protein